MVGLKEKVVLSLTRQMEDDFSAVVGQGGRWGLGLKLTKCR